MPDHSQKKEKDLIPASNAARQVGYTTDYVTRLARDGVVRAVKIGRQWHVQLASVKKFADEAQKISKQRTAQLRAQRKKEYRARQQDLRSEVRPKTTSADRSRISLERRYVEHLGFILSNEAAKRTKYTGDYVARLARESIVPARKVGKQWYVDPTAVEVFAARARSESEKRTEQLREVRKIEYTERQRRILREAAVAIRSARMFALAQMTALIFVLVVGVGGYLTAHQEQLASATSAGLSIMAPTADFARTFYYFISPNAKYAHLQSTVAQTTNQRTQSYDITVLDSDTKLDAVKAAFSDKVDASFDVEVSDTGVITPQFRDRPGNDYRFKLLLEEQKSHAQGG